MSGYGPPQVQQSGSNGSGLPLPTLLAYVAGGLGVLDFVWGFLDWLGDGPNGVTGYYSSGGAAVGLGLAAGLWAAGRTLEKNAAGPALGPVALAVASLLVVFGNLVGQPTGADTKIGMILTLITAVLQTGVLVYGWLVAVGRISAPAPKPAASQSFGPPPGFGSPQGSQSPAYGQPSGPPQGGYGAPGSFGPPSGQPGYGPATSPGQSGGYGQPGSSQPGYGQPGGSSAPGQSGPPHQGGYGQPGQSQPPSQGSNPGNNPYGPPPGSQQQ